MQVKGTENKHLLIGGKQSRAAICGTRFARAIQKVALSSDCQRVWGVQIDSDTHSDIYISQIFGGRETTSLPAVGDEVRVTGKVDAE